MKLGPILKKKTTWIGLIVVALMGFWWFKSSATTKTATSYVLGEVTKGTITVSVDGTGQVSALNQIDVKPEVSGKVLKIPVTEGQLVKAGDVLAQLDATDAYQAVRDATLSLESAQLTLQKLVQPADELSVTQAENALAQAEQNKQTSQSDLNKAYDDGYTAIDNSFLDLPGIVTGLHDILFSNTYTQSQWNMDYYVNAVANYDNRVKAYRDDAYQDYQSARAAYDKNFSDYKNLSRATTDPAKLQAMVKETYATAQGIASAVKSANNLIQFYEDRLVEHSQKPQATADTELTSLNTYTSKINSHVSDLLNITNTITNDTNAITSANGTITEKTQSLAKLKAGADSLDVKSAELTVRQRQASLSDAQINFSKYTIRAPFDAVVATIGAKVGDSAGASSAVATLVASQQIATISLNEVDAAKIKVGQKVTMTFDAIDGLTLTGRVGYIDTIGTVSQGVVTYNVKIVFDTQDNRIKPGMSVAASVITDVHQDVLMVPSGAVTTQGTQNFVSIFSPAIPTANGTTVTSPTAPTRQAVEIGLSDDTNTEIVSGLAEGAQVVTRTITGSTTGAAATTAPSLFGAVGGRTTGGAAAGAVRNVQFRGN